MDNDELYYSSVKDWYIENYPTDELGVKLPDTIGETRGDFFQADIAEDPSFADYPITFETYFAVLDGHGDVYELMGNAAGSIIRVRIFQQLADCIGEDYNYVYEQWLRSASR